LKIKDLKDSGWSLSDDKTESLLNKIRAAGIPLNQYVNGKIFYGIKTGLNEAFVIDEKTKNRLIKEDKKSKEIIKPFLAGKEIKRYQSLRISQYLVFTRRGIEINNYPAIKQYFSNFKERLIPRPIDWAGDVWNGRKPGTYKWYEIQDSVDYWQEFEKKKIIYAEIATKGQFTFDDENFYSDTTSYILGSDSKYLLGILNSKLITFIFSKISSEIQGGFFRWKRQYIEFLPIRLLDLSLPSEEFKHNQIIKHATLMLDLNKKLPFTKTEHEKVIIQRQIDDTDKQIDKLVYDLYNLTEEEIKVVEESLK
jgi:hypothetical protein